MTAISFCFEFHFGKADNNLTCDKQLMILEFEKISDMEINEKQSCPMGRGGLQ